jgi:hypothetical protein
VGGNGGEMTQTLYAHINKIKKKKEKPNSIRLPTAKDGTI